jgi:RNA polymerase sigma-70 factor (ECF subfamily)
MNPKDQKLLEALKKGNIPVFESIFRSYYPNLCHFAFQYVQDKAVAENVVQETFVRIWEKRSTIIISKSIQNYLLEMVKNRCLNYLEHASVRRKYAEKVRSKVTIERKESQDIQFFEVGLSEKIQASIEALPEKRQQIFRMCKQDGLSYKQVAEKLGVSVKTVENHMGLALKELRQSLKEYKNHFLLFSLFQE